MLRSTLTGIALFLAASALAQTEIYRWVDEDGVVHYSDQAGPGAEKVQLDDAPAIRMPVPRRAARSTAAGSPPEAREAEVGYRRLEVVSPSPEETLWNIGGVLEVAVDVQPALQRNHQLRVYYDGNPVAVDGTRFRLNEVYRGAHNLQAEVVNQGGEVLARSQPVRFYVQQTSLLNPGGG